MSTTGPFVEEPVRPRAYWYWIGGLLIAAGVIGAIVWFVVGIVGLSDAVDDFERVPYDGGGTVVLDDSGGYVVYAEGNGVDVASGLRISVVGPDGAPVPTAAYGGSLTYDFGGRAGSAVATFDAPAPGAYRVAPVEAASGFAERLAVGPSIAGDLVRTLVGAFLIGGAGVIVGVVVVIVTAVRRSRARRRRAPAPPTSGWPAQPGGPLPPPTY